MTAVKFEAHTPQKKASLRQRRPWIMGAALAVAAVMLAVGGLAARYWPYRHREVLPLLDEVFVSQNTMEKYHRTYFPRPGFVASGLTLRRKTADPTLPPFGTAQDLIVQGSWLDLLLLRHRVELVDVVGLHLVVPPAGSAERQREFPPGSTLDFSGPSTTVGRLQIWTRCLSCRGRKAEAFPSR